MNRPLQPTPPKKDENSRGDYLCYTIMCLVFCCIFLCFFTVFSPALLLVITLACSTIYFAREYVIYDREYARYREAHGKYLMERDQFIRDIRNYHRKTISSNGKFSSQLQGDVLTISMENGTDKEFITYRIPYE